MHTRTSTLGLTGFNFDGSWLRLEVSMGIMYCCVRCVFGTVDALSPSGPTNRDNCRQGKHLAETAQPRPPRRASVIPTPFPRLEIVQRSSCLSRCRPCRTFDGRLAALAYLRSLSSIHTTFSLVLLVTAVKSNRMSAVTSFAEAVQFAARCVECPICKGPPRTLRPE